MDTFEIVHIGPRRAYQQPLKVSIIDVCILFDKKTKFSVEYYDSRTGCDVVRDFHSYELQFKFSFINDLIPEYFIINVPDTGSRSFTVLVQNDSNVRKYNYVVDSATGISNPRYKVDVLSVF
jgi:hypothetical protein